LSKSSFDYGIIIFFSPIKTDVLPFKLTIKDQKMGDGRLTKELFFV